MDFNTKREKLDYGSILFRQLDRINMLFTETGVLTSGGLNRNFCYQNTYSALGALESSVKFKLGDELKSDFLKEKKKLGLEDFDIFQCDATSNLKYYDLLMSYISKAGLLPAPRETFSSFKEEEVMESEKDE